MRSALLHVIKMLCFWRFFVVFDRVTILLTRPIQHRAGKNKTLFTCQTFFFRLREFRRVISVISSIFQVAC